MKIRYILFLLVIIFSQQKFAQEDSTDIKTVLGLYENFETTVKNKDRNGHLRLMLFPTMPVNIISKSPTGPTISYGNASGWINFFTNPNMPYELVIDNIETKLEENVGVTIATFKEYVGGQYNAYGTDVFSYVKSQFGGWQYSTFNNTVVLTSDNTDYTTPYPINGSPEETLNNFLEDVSNKDRSAILSNFTSSNAQFMTVEGVFGQTYSTLKHVAGPATDEIINTTGTYQLEINNREIDIHDQYVATVRGDYVIKIDGSVSESGRVVMVMNASRSAGWRINVLLKSKQNNITSVQSNNEIVNDFRLNQNYPNPFNPETNISFQLPKSSYVTLKVYNTLGKEVATVIENELASGQHSINFNANNLSSGTYFYQLKTKDFIETRKMIYLK